MASKNKIGLINLVYTYKCNQKPYKYWVELPPYFLAKNYIGKSKEICHVVFVNRKNRKDTVDLFWVLLEARFSKTLMINLVYSYNESEKQYEFLRTTVICSFKNVVGIGLTASSLPRRRSKACHAFLPTNGLLNGAITSVRWRLAFVLKEPIENPLLSACQVDSCQFRLPCA